MGQLGAEVVKSCMKTAGKNRVPLNVCVLHVIPVLRCQGDLTLLYQSKVLT